MNNTGFFDSLGIYAADVQVAGVRSRGIIWLVALGWFLLPFILQMLVYPSDMIRVGAFLQGARQPVSFTLQQLAAGFVETLFVLAAFISFQFIGTLLFYRRAALHGERVSRPALWPIAAVSVGLLGNAIWFVCLGYFDFEGVQVVINKGDYYEEVFR